MRDLTQPKSIGHCTNCDYEGRLEKDSKIKDEEFGVSEKYEKLNKEFYGN